MMRERLIWIVVAIVAGFAGVALVQQYLQQRERELEKRYAAFRNAVKIVVASEDIPEETLISAKMIEPRPVPELFVQPYATTDPNAVVGKLTAVPIAKGEQILTTKLGIPGSRKTLSAKMEAGKRAITIGVDTISGVGGFLRPGDRVDLLGVFSIPSPQGAQALTVTLLQHVLVLAVGGEVIDQPARTAQKGSGEGPMVITLALSPQETELVLFAREQGKLQLSLRPKADKDVVQVQPFSMSTLVGLINPGAQEAPPPPKHKEVEVYRGLKRDVVVIPQQ
jgi:pilus assembly protein CpaB